MKKRTCKFGWTDNMAIAEKLGREIAKRDLTAGSDMIETAHRNHKKRVALLNNINKGGVQPLSRMHPDHPIRRQRRSLTAPKLEAFSATQKFAP